MVMLRNTFNTDEHAQGEFALLPEGEYVLRCTDTEKREAASGEEMLAVEFEVVEPANRRRLNCTCFINFWHSKEQVREIAFAELGRILQAMDLPRINDTSDMHGKQVAVLITHEPSGGRTYHRFQGWGAPGDVPPPAATQAPAKKPITEPDDDLPF